MPPRHELQDLLLGLFDAQELRRLVRYLPDGDRLTSALPGPTASAAHLAEETVTVVLRNGVLDDLLAAARHERPRRVAEIDGVAASLAAPAATPAPRVLLPRPCRTFVSYSHVDSALIAEMRVHFALLIRQGIVELWTDHAIDPGLEWAREIDERLEAAHLVLLAISPNFIASDYCWGKELDRAIARHQAGTCRVVPLFLRQANSAGAPYMGLQGLPRDAKPITLAPDRDSAWTEVAAAIRKLIVA